MLARLKFASPALYSGVLIVFAMSIIGFADNLVQVIAEDIGLWQFHLLRTLMALPVMAVFSKLAGAGLWPRRWWPVLLRTGLLTTSMLLYFASLPMMPIAQAAAGLFTSPIFVLIFSVVFFRLRIGIWRIAAVLLGFAGVLIILRPDAPGFDPLLLMPVVAGAFYAMSTIATRQWCADEGTTSLLMVSFMALGLAGLAGSLVLAVLPAPDALLARAEFFFAPWAAPSLPVWGLIAVQALVSLIAVAALTRGYQSAETSYVTVFEYSFLIMASFWAWILWGAIPQASDVIGIATIIAAGTIIALRSGRVSVRAPVEPGQ